MPKTRKFPEQVFVNWYEDSDNSLLPNVSESADDALTTEPQEIATYKLVSVRKGKLVAHFDE